MWQWYAIFFIPDWVGLKCICFNQRYVQPNKIFFFFLIIQKFDSFFKIKKKFQMIFSSIFQFFAYSSLITNILIYEHLNISNLGLIERGHKVIIITHSYDNRQGVRYVTHGLKVYYCPLSPFVDQATFPNFLGFFPLFRKIVIREKIQIIHAHQV